MRHSELLRKATLGFQEAVTEEDATCHTCEMFITGKKEGEHSCGLGLPEFLTEESKDCIHFNTEGTNK